MPSSSDEHHRIAGVADPPDNSTGPDDDDDDEYEYEEIEEEIEVEEEVEVEEELEEEEGGEQEEGEDLSDSPIDDDPKDISQGMKSAGHEELSKSLSSAPEKSLATMPSETLPVEGGSCKSRISSTSEDKSKEESLVVSGEVKYSKNGGNLVASVSNRPQEASANKKISDLILPEKEVVTDHSAVDCEGKSPLRHNGIAKAGTTTESIDVTGKEVAAAVLVRDGFCEGDSGDLHNKEETKLVGTTSGEDTKLRISSSSVPQIRPRSLSPGAEFKDGNKRPVIICDFFAKGWCIKGNSCRFLHIKDRGDVISQRPEGDVAAAIPKSEFQADEGFRDGNERSRLPGFLNSSTSSTVSSNSFSSGRIQPVEHGEGPSLQQLSEKHNISSHTKENLSSGYFSDSRMLPLYEDKSKSMPPPKDFDRTSLGQSWRSHNYHPYASPIAEGSSPARRNSLFHDHVSFSSSLASLSDTYRSTGMPLFATSSDEHRRSQFMLNDHSSPILTRSLAASSITSSMSAGAMPPWTRSSYSLSSLKIDPLGSQKLPDYDTGYHNSRPASLLQRSSPVSFSDSEKLSFTNNSGNPQRTSGLKTKFSFNDWEPSVPFRPTFFISSQRVSSPGSQYDPIRDSIEQPSLGDGLSKYSSSNHGASLLNLDWQKSSDPIFGRTLNTNNSSDKHYSHKKFNANGLEDGIGKNLYATEAETVRPVAKEKNRSTLSKEEKQGSVKEITNPSKINFERGLQSDGSRNKMEVKVDRHRINNEIDVDPNNSRDMPKESKTLKHFRAALVEFVKELVKPTWREGNLSKDAHKMIVKKAVDKVLSTLQPNQIPSTAELIEQYLSSSEPKMVKLVEGYVDKYGKS